MSPARKGIKLLDFKPSNSTDKRTEIAQREEAICIENILVLLIASILIVMPIVLSVTLAVGA
ncbi:hypothetical protein K438DRAFT_1982183 [Mycena galopus ATCC 62051]|nr:hypothetical protein K438DRAFT_1982183 [Mycena galopus ATCC 62051]